jgi:nicotinic acid mononucleotide adenylyltransferase
MNAGEILPHIALLSGAFNPLHEAHRRLAEAAAQILGQEVYFELALVNADKAPISLEEAQRRVAQFAGLGTVILTRAPLFSQKARLFPHSVFVLGIDTVERLIQPRFYHNDPAEMLASFKAIRTAGCHFLVAGRLRGTHFLTLQDLELPQGYRELFEEIPGFRMDISSTAIREGSADTNA